MAITKRVDHTYTVTDADRELVQSAVEAFALDHRYLESILLAAQARKSNSKQTN